MVHPEHPPAPRQRPRALRLVCDFALLGRGWRGRLSARVGVAEGTAAARNWAPVGLPRVFGDSFRDLFTSER